MQATGEGQSKQPSACLVTLDGKELYTFKGQEGDQCNTFWVDSLLLLSLWKVSHKSNPMTIHRAVLWKEILGHSQVSIHRET